MHGLSFCVYGSVYQWGANPRSAFRKKRLLEEDVQISECCQWYKQPIRAGYVRVHHCPLWYYHRTSFTITFPTDFITQEAQTALRYVFVWEKFVTNITIIVSVPLFSHTKHIITVFTMNNMTSCPWLPFLWISLITELLYKQDSGFIIFHIMKYIYSLNSS